MFMVSGGILGATWNKNPPLKLNGGFLYYGMDLESFASISDFMRPSEFACV